MKLIGSIYCSSPAETKKLAQELVSYIELGTVFALSGTLGTGKTFFVQRLAEALGAAKGQIQSPTFAMIQEHPEETLPLCHVDLYRIPEPEIRNLGLEDYWNSQQWWVAIEWADKALPLLPDHSLYIQIENRGETGRQFYFKGDRTWQKKLKRLLLSWPSKPPEKP